MFYTLLVSTLIFPFVFCTPLTDTRNGHSIPLVRREAPPASILSLQDHVTSVISKYTRGFYAYSLNTGTPHPLDTPAYRPFNKRGPTTVRLTQDPNKTLWQGVVAIGTPPTQFTVDFDTGSSDMYLPGVACTENCHGHRVYNPRDSASARDLNQTFGLSFGDDSTVTGEIYQDRVSVGQLPVANQVLGVASSYSHDNRVEIFSPDGLVGLAYPSISDLNATPLVHNLFAEGRIPKPVFGFEFNGGQGLLHLGRSLSGTFRRVYYTPVTEQGFWQVTLDAVSVASIVALQSQRAVIDTGTTVVIAPTSAVDGVYAAIPSSKKLGNGFYTLPCSTMPTVSFTFAGQSFGIAPNLFNLGAVSRSNGLCFGGIVGTDDVDFWIVGDIFLQGVYTEFDFGNNRVGFARSS